MHHFKGFTLLITLMAFVLLGSAQRTYTSFPEDPMQRRIYVLDNGLTVCMSQNPQDAHIECALFIRAGSYLETDSTQSLAFLAARNLISDDYVQLLNKWGANEPVTTTTYDWSTIQENIPANRLEQWATLLQERLEHPAFRLSTTDLFHITDEINDTRNDDHLRAYDLLRDALYPNHPYGRAFTDSLSELLDDTTITKLTHFYQHFYTPSNMVLCLSGDFLFDNAINIIDKHLGKLPTATVTLTPTRPLPAMPQMAERRLTGDFQAFVTVGYRLDVPQTAHNHLMMELISIILYNRYCGLMDEALQGGLLQNGFATTEEQWHSSLLLMAGYPQEEQQMADIRDFLFQSIMRLKTGDFSDQLFTAAKSQLKLDFLQQNSGNTSRVQQMLESFQQSENGQLPILTASQFDKLSKQDVTDFANQYLQDNCVVVYKAKGEKAQPERFLLPRCITKMKHNDSERALISQLKTEIPSQTVTTSTPSKEETPGLFSLTLTFPAGELNDLRIPYAANYWQTVGTQQHTAQALHNQWFALGCQYDLYCSDKSTTFTLTGLSESFNAALHLLSEEVLQPVADTAKLRLMMENIIAQRQQGKQSFVTIANCFRTYCAYGNGLIQYQLQNEQLKEISGDDLLSTFRQLWHYGPEIDYSGPMTEKQVRKALAQNHLLSKRNLVPPTAKVFHNVTTSSEQVFFLSYPARTAHLFRYSCNEPTDTSLDRLAQLYTEYFSQHNQSILNQKMSINPELRCRVCNARFVVPKDKNEMMFGEAYASVGYDKIAENMQMLDSLCNQLPIDTLLFHDITTNGAFSTFAMEDLLGFSNEHIAHRPKYWGIIAPESVLEQLRSTGLPVSVVTLEDIFGY